MVLDDTLIRLTAGGARLSAVGAHDRAALARTTARSVADAADRWVDAALAIKQATREVAEAAAAEETSTGPIATLRLLAMTARAWE